MNSIAPTEISRYRALRLEITAIWVIRLQEGEQKAQQ
jgi:hypothetical protein